jgi:rare lipoprotein A
MRIAALPLSLLLLLLLTLAGCAHKPAYRSRVLDTPETKGLKGWEKPYEVNGERYQPMRATAPVAGYAEEGTASWYGADFHGKATSCGETYDMHAMTAAHKTLPLGVWVRVTNRANGRSCTVRVNDRGPFVKSRIIDLSFAAAKELGVVGPGTAPVRIEALGFREQDAQGRVAWRQPKSYSVGSYAVQIGSFALRDNADRLAAQMRGRLGAAAVQEGWVGGRLFYRVRVGDYRTIEAAEVARAGFEQGGYANSFVVAME